MAFGLIVTLLPAAVIVTALIVSARLHQGFGDLVFRLAVLAMGALFGNVLARGIGLEGGKVALVSALVGGAAVYGFSRLRAGRMLLEYLAVANVFFLVGFLVFSPTSQLIGGDSGELDLGKVSVPTPPGPVVVIVFDELPISTLMLEDGTINAERFPGFARLAEGSTWYRNTSSDHHRTERAVPELLTGTIPATDALPSHIDLPRNLLTMFADSVPVERYEAITDMCPPSLCVSRASQSLEQALSDAAVVYGHRVLPRRLRDRLPAIDQGWGGFGDHSGGVAAAAAGDSDVFESGRLGRWWEKSDAERSPANQVAILESEGAGIDGKPELSFSHVVVPHAPWVITPWGTSLMGGAPELVTAPDDPAYEWSGRLQYQRHALQVGAADVALGRVIDHLQSTGVWEDTTLVVMADHGTSLLAPDFGRDVITANNTQEVYRIPMFIKAAGQTTGEVDDEPAQAIDMLPTLADLLDIDTDWEFDGHSLLDDSKATVDSLVGAPVEPLFEIVARHAAQFPHGNDWTALAAVGEHGAMVGTPLADHEVGAPSSMRLAAGPPRRVRLASDARRTSAAAPDRSGADPRRTATAGARGRRQRHDRGHARGVRAGRRGLEVRHRPRPLPA